MGDRIPKPRFFEAVWGLIKAFVEPANVCAGTEATALARHDEGADDVVGVPGPYLVCNFLGHLRSPGVQLFWPIESQDTDPCRSSP